MNRAYCLGCGYSLVHLPEPRCPECGGAFDLGDPFSYARVRPPGPIARILATPVGWPMHVLAAVATCLSFGACSAPGGYFDLSVLAFFSWLAVGAIWVFRGVARAAVLPVYGHIEGSAVGRKGPWVVAPSMALVTVVVCFAGLPATCCFRLSRSAMDQLADQAAALPSGTAMPSRWVGLYRAQDITVLPGGVRFLIRGAGFPGAERGFARSAQALVDGPDGYPHYFYWPHRDGWYHCVRKFLSG